MSRDLFKQIRLTLGLGQVEFAKLLGISSSYVAMIDAGRREVSDNVERLVREKVDSELINQVKTLIDLKQSLEK